MGERLVFIDTETTGISARHGHRIVELAAVEVIGGKSTGRVLHSLFDPERPVDLGAERVHGLCSSALLGKPKFRDFAGNLLEFVRGSECIMHNAAFDTAFIDSELERAGYHERLATVARIICSMRLAKARYPGESATLDALVRVAPMAAQQVQN